MSAPIRSQTEIDQILNRANHTIADLGLEIINDANQGVDINDVDYRDKVYRIILLRAYLKNIIDPTTGEPRLYFTDDSDNEKAYNRLLDGIVALSSILDGPGIPMIRGRRAPLLYFPSTSGPSAGGQSNSGGAAAPGGITFQNNSVESPGEVVDRLDASGSEYAFYIVNVRGTGADEGSRLDILGVNWRGSADPVITNYRGNDVGGSTSGVTFSAAIVDGSLELTCNVPTDGWVVRGTRVSFENISFQNAQGPMPVGGTAGQYLRKTSSTDYEAAFASIAISEVAELVAALAAKVAKDGSIAMTGNLAMGSNKITGLADGTNAGDAVNKSQLDALKEDGPFTPSASASVNVSSVNFGNCQYVKVGNAVTISGEIQVDTIAGGGTLTTVSFTIPVDSDFATNGQLAGTAVSIVEPQAARLRADHTNNLAVLEFYADSDFVYNFSFHATYIVI